MSNARLRWGILSTGKIAATFARAVAASESGVVTAVGSRSRESAEKFAGEHGVNGAHAHATYEALLADAAVDAVYVATPHPQHAEWVIKAAAAGKHILCEKPIAVTLADTRRMVAAAREHGVLLMEAFMYRCHPQTERVAGLIADGALGKIGTVQAAFSFRCAYDAQSRLWANELAGGGILDVGGYPVSWARRIAGAAAGKVFLDPSGVAGAGVLHPETRVDSYASALLTFPNEILAQVSCGVGLTQEGGLKIFGTEGWLHVPTPYVVGRNAEPAKIVLHRAGGKAPEEITIESDRDLYTYEADAFAAAWRAGARDVTAMTTEDTIGNMAVLDRWLAQAGVVYGKR